HQPRRLAAAPEYERFHREPHAAGAAGSRNAAADLTMFSPVFALPNRLAKGGKPTANPVSVPAPTGGWNARDSLPQMGATDAIYLDNFIPDAEGVQQRRGSSVFSTGLAGQFVESLMEYNAANTAPQLLAATPARIYDVSAAGPGSLQVTGLSNGRWQHTM